MINQEVIKSGLDGLERKILMLLNERQALKKELEHMKLEHQRLKDDLHSKKEAMNDLQQNIQISEIANHIGENRANKAILRKKVDTYIAEIDRCIAHLNA